MRRPSVRAFTILALAVAVGLALAVSPFASTSPDGLTKVSEDRAFAHHAKVQRDSPIPAYEFPGIENDRLAKGVAASWARSGCSWWIRLCPDAPAAGPGHGLSRDDVRRPRPPAHRRPVI